MRDRRPMGSLEADVLAYLWSRSEPVAPAEVRDALGSGLAYTTITTILIRLCEKGVIGRERAGRVFLYRPTVTEADYAAQRMDAALGRVTDRAAALHRFVGRLSERDAEALRRVIDQLDGGEDR